MVKGVKKGEKKTSDMPTPEEIRSRIDHLKNLNIKPTAVTKALARYKKELGVDDERAKRTLKTIDTSMSAALKKWEEERTSLQVSLFVSAFDKMDELGLDSAPLRKRMEKMEKRPAKGKERSVSKEVTDLSMDIERSLSGHPETIIGIAVSAFDRGLNNYIESSIGGSLLHESRKFFKKAWENARKKDIGNLLVYSNLLMNAAESEISESVAKDRYRSIMEQLEKFNERIEDFREFGIDTDPITKELSSLQRDMQNRAIGDVQSTIVTLDLTVNRLEQEYLRKKGDINLIETSLLMGQYGNLIDLSEFRTRMDKLRDDQGKMSPNRYLEESQTLVQQLKQDLHETFRDQVQERLSGIDGFIEGIPQAAEEYRSPLTEIRDMSHSFLMKGDITEAMEYLSMAESMIGHIEGEMVLKEIRSNYSFLLSEFQAMTEEDLDLTEVKVLIDEIEGMFLHDEVKPAIILERITEGDRLLRGKVTEVRSSRFQKERGNILRSLEDLGIEDPRKEEIIAMMDSLESDIDGLSEGEFRERQGAIHGTLDALLTDHYRDNFAMMGERIGGTLEELASMGADVSAFREDLDKAHTEYETGDHLAGGRALSSLEDRIKGVDLEVRAKAAEDRINSAEFIFEEAKRSGVIVDPAYERLIEAKRLLTEGDFVYATEIASNMEEEIKGKWMEQRKDRLFGDILTLKDLVGDTESFGVEFEGINDLIHSAETLFKEGRIDDAKVMIQRAKDSLDSSRKQFFSESAMSSIQSVKEEVREAEAMGVSTLEVETLLMEAERSFLNEDYEDAYRLTLDIRQKVHEAKKGHIRDEIPRRIDEVMGKVNKLDAMGLDTSGVKDLIDQSTVHMYDGDLDRSLSEMSSARELVDDLYHSQVSVTIPESIVDVKKQIQEAMALGIDLEDLNDLLGTAEQMFVKEEYDSALNRIDEVQQMLSKQKGDFLRDRFVNKLGDVETLIGSSKGLDRELVLSKENINMARDAFERGDYEASHALLDRVMNYIQESVSVQEASKIKSAVMSQFEEVNLLIEVARSENIDVSAETNIMKMALELIEKGDLTQAEQVIQGVKKGIQDKRIDMKRDLIESSVQTTEIILYNMKEMGMDVTTELSLMADLKEALRRGDLELCDTINRRLEDTLRKNRGPYTVQKVQKDITALRGRVMEAESSGIEVDHVRQIIAEAQTRYDRGDMDGSMVVVKKGNEVLDEAIAEHQRSEFDSQLQELDERIERMRVSAIPFEDEVNVREQAIQLMDDGDVEQALMWVNTALIGANAKIASFQRTTAEGWMAQIDEYIKSLSSMGLQTDDLKKIFNEGMDLHGSGQDDKAISKFSSILELGEDKRRSHQLEYLLGLFQRLKRWYTDLAKFDFRPSKETADLQMSIEGDLSAKRFDMNDMEDRMNRLRSLLETEGSKMMPELSKMHIMEATRSYKALEEKGISDDSILDLTQLAGKSWREGDHLTADEHALKAIERIERLTAEGSEESLRAELTSVRQMITKLKTMGSNVENPENLYSRAEVALKEGKFKGAKKILKSIRDSIREIVERNLRESSRETIEFTEAMVKYLTDNFSGISVKLQPAMEMLNRAREDFQAKNFKNARTKANHARRMVEQVDHTNIGQFLYVFRSSQATEFKNDISQRISELSKKGVDTSKASVLFRDAEKLFDSDQFDKGREMIILTRILLSELDTQSLKDQAFDAMNDAHVAIITAKKKGSETDAALKKYNKAKEAFALKEYKKALLMARKISYSLKK